MCLELSPPRRVSWLRSLARVAPFLFLAGGCRVELLPGPDDARYRQAAALAIADARTSWQGAILFGSAHRELVPPFPIPLSGFGGIHRRLLPPLLQTGTGDGTLQAPYERVEIPPRVKVLLLASAERNTDVVLLVSVDVVAVTSDMKGRLLAALARKRPEWALTPERLLLMATHTHSGPAGLSQDPLFEVVAGDLFSERLFAFFEKEFLEAVDEADSRRSPLRNWEHLKTELPAFNDTRVHDLPADPTANLVVARGQSESACIVSYAFHPTSVGQRERTLTADLAGRLERELEARGGYETCLFLPGQLGNATARLDKRTPAQYAEELSETLLERFNAEKREIAATRLRVEQRKVRLPAPRFNFKACGASALEPFVNLALLEARPIDTPVALLDLSGIPFALIPAEAASDFRLLVPNASNLIVTSVAQDYQGYLVSEKHYEEPSLEACSTLYPAVLRTMLAEKTASMLSVPEE